MAQPSEAFREAKAFFHALSKVNTEISQYVYESLYKSAHTVLSDDIWADPVAYCVDAAAADAWVIANPIIGHKYTVVDLTEVPGSNGQAWFVDDGGSFITKWISPTDIPHSATKAPSYGYQLTLYQDDGITIIPPAVGVWVADYYAGLVLFQNGQTPADLGYGTPKISLYNYVGTTGGGGGTGSVILYDETTALGPVTTLRAVGADISAEVIGTDGYLYVPPASFAPAYNTGACVVPSISTVNRHVPAPTSPGVPFGVGDWVGGLTYPVHRDLVSTVYATPTACTFISQLTTFEVIVYGDDDVTPVATYTTPALIGNTSVSGSDLTVTITNWSTEFSKYKADISVTIGTGAIFPNGGRYSVELIHHNGPDYTFTQGPMFMDQESSVATVAGVTISENLPVTKPLSGVRHYTLNSTFNVAIADIDNINDSSYQTNFLYLEATDYALPLIAGSAVDLVGWTTQWDNVDASYFNNAWTISTLNVSTITLTGSARGRTEDWTAGAWISTTTTAILVDTLVNGSSSIIEDFNTETKRLESDLVTAWDSLQDISLYDGGNGLQISGGRLIYPTLDYSVYDPNPLGQPTYSLLAGDRDFYTRMWHTGVAHSNGIIELSDYNITEADLTAYDVILDISLDGVSWYSVNDPYAGGPLLDGNGCRINSGVTNLPANNRLQFTLGAGGTTGAATGGGWGIYIRIRFTDTDKSNYIGDFQIVDWI